MPTLTDAPRPARNSSARLRALLRLGVVVALHAVLLLALARLDPEIRKKVEPVLVSLITPPAPVADPPPPPPPPPAKAQPPQIKAQPAAPKPVARPEPQPAAITVEVPPESPPAPVVMPTPSASMEGGGVAASAPAVVESKPAPRPVVPPRFDAAYLNNPRPEYPRVARRMGEQGKVMLHVYVSASGAAEKVEIRTSSGSPRLDQAARDAVERWKFVPAKQGDEPIGAWVLVPITFVLEG